LYRELEKEQHNLTFSELYDPNYGYVDKIMSQKSVKSNEENLESPKSYPESNVGQNNEIYESDEFLENS